jgi:hypothetical protein
MEKQEIRSPNGKLLGTIRREGSRLVARSVAGHMLGYYSESDGRTRTPSGQMIAQGNVLASLIYDQ